jgi:hypothetical protein
MTQYPATEIMEYPLFYCELACVHSTPDEWIYNRVHAGNGNLRSHGISMKSAAWKSSKVMEN